MPSVPSDAPKPSPVASKTRKAAGTEVADDDIGAWLGIRDRPSKSCDVCGDPISAGSGFITSTKEIVGSPAYWRQYYSMHQAEMRLLGATSFIEFTSNSHLLSSVCTAIVSQTTPWLVCEKCVIFFPKIDHDRTHADAVIFWNTDGAIVPIDTSPASLSDIRLETGPLPLCPCCHGFVVDPVVLALSGPMAMAGFTMMTGCLKMPLFQGRVCRTCKQPLIDFVKSASTQVWAADDALQNGKWSLQLLDIKQAKKYELLNRLTFIFGIESDRATQEWLDFGDLLIWESDTERPDKCLLFGGRFHRT